MPNPRIASRYAKALLDLAVEKGQLDPVNNDMQYLQQLNRSSRDFLNLLRSPIVSVAKKQSIISSVTEGKISEVTASFIRLLVSKGREGDLPEIITSFIQQYKDRKGIRIVKLTTATPVSEDIKSRIVDQVKRTSDLQNIELETTVDPNIIGGFVLQAGDKLVDASVAYDLKEISRYFENNDFIYKVR